MGNKTAGRAVAALPNIEYQKAMGATVNSDRALIKNTGVDFTNWAVLKYFRLLREYALNRVIWRSDVIDDYELRLIEWNIFHYGKCAMLRPRITVNGVRMELKKPRIYQCNFTKFNHRNGRPERISIVNNQHDKFIIDVEYNSDDFVIFTDEFLFSNETNPFYHVAWEFACKLYELDLAFNANSHRLRMPFVFSTGGLDSEKEANMNIVSHKISIAELMRSAYGRNEQFVEIEDSNVGRNGFMFEPQYVNNEMPTLIECQKKLYQAYLERLGLYTNQDKSGVYTIKDIQEEGDESGDYITRVYKNTRLLCMAEAVKKFNINMSLEVVK